MQTLVEGDRLNLGYGAQDLSPFDNGAYTGDISAEMLVKLGCRYVVVGHSERRRFHGEDDNIVNAKTIKAVSGGLTPIVCVGEGLAVRQELRQVPDTLAHVEGALTGLTAEQVGALVIAYEPVWAIGTGRVATPEDAQEVCAAIRGWIRRPARAGRRRRDPHPVRRIGERQQRRRPDGRGRTSTAAWSATRAWTSSSSPAIARFYDLPVLVTARARAAPTRAGGSSGAVQPTLGFRRRWRTPSRVS